MYIQSRIFLYQSQHLALLVMLRVYNNLATLPVRCYRLQDRMESQLVLVLMRLVLVLILLLQVVQHEVQSNHQLPLKTKTSYLDFLHKDTVITNMYKVSVVSLLRPHKTLPMLLLAHRL